MARQRMLKPEFFTDEDLSAQSLAARLLFAGLWTMADRRGRLKDQPPVIHGALFPFDPALDVDQILDDLERGGFVVRYAVEGRKYLQIVNFERHQHPHPKEPESAIPEPCTGNGSAVESNGSAAEKAVPSPSESESFPSESESESGQPGGPPAGPRVVRLAMTPERQALKDAREALRRELIAVTMLRGAGDGQRELARASKTPGGQVIVNPAGCSSLPWLQTTIERLTARRMELEERQAEDLPPPVPTAPEVNPEAAALFEAVRTRLSGVLDSRAWATWIRPLYGLGFRLGDDALVIAAPSRQFVEWVGRNYSDAIAGGLRDLGRESRFELRVVAEPATLHAGSIR